MLTGEGYIGTYALGEKREGGRGGGGGGGGGVGNGQRTIVVSMSVKTPVKGGCVV